MKGLNNLKYLLILLLLLIPISLVIGLWMMGFDIELSLESVAGATMVLLAIRLSLTPTDK